MAALSYGRYIDFGYVCTVTLGQGHDTHFGHGQQLCEILSRSNMAVRSYCPDIDFGYACTVTLEIWPLVKVMTHPWVMDNNCAKYYQDPTRQWGVMAGTWILVSVHCDLGDLTLCWGHDTPLGYRQQLWKILLRSNKAVRSYCLDIDFGYVCTVTLEIWTWVKVTTHPWVMDNYCVKYYPDPTRQWGVIARTSILLYLHCDLGLRSWHTLGSWTTIAWNIILIQHGSKEKLPGHRFLVCVHCDLDNMTLG